MSNIKPCLVEEQKSLKFHLEFTSTNKVGRGTSPKASNITIDLVSDSVSSNHATIDFAKGKWIFRDESSHGSIVNGQTIHNASIVIKHKDSINIGEYHFVFFDENAVGIIGGTQKISKVNPVILEKAAELTQKSSFFEEWKESSDQENAIVAFVCMLLFLILFIGIFFNFFFDL